uniref:Neutral ceramidase 2-like n=1 Tax=Tanacetum cinerariifolium TaxID=118510 RepID=A0A699HBM3_TANCI|nr:neutral ceramidase 2-like [Tanacetum cinerariifolium]
MFLEKVYPIGASNVGDPAAVGASNRYLGTRFPMDVVEYQMPLLREIEIRLKKKYDKLADAFIDSDLGDGTVVNASPCAEVVARSATWLGRVLSCVCAQSIEDNSRPSFDLIPAQTNTRHFQSVFKYLLVDVALVPEKLKRIPLQVRELKRLYPPDHILGFAFAAGTTDRPGAFDFTQRDDQLVGGLLKKPDEKQIKGQDPKPILIDSGEMHEPYDWATELITKE